MIESTPGFTSAQALLRSSAPQVMTLRISVSPLAVPPHSALDAARRCMSPPALVARLASLPPILRRTVGRPNLPFLSMARSVANNRPIGTGSPPQASSVDSALRRHPTGPLAREVAASDAHVGRLQPSVPHGRRGIGESVRAMLSASDKRLRERLPS